MAKGRRDYTWGVLQDTVQVGLYSSNLQYTGHVVIAAPPAFGDAISYEVPAGYKLFLLGVVCTCQYPGINLAIIGHGEPGYIYAYFDTMASFNLGSYGSISYKAGRVLKVRIYNYDTITQDFWVTIYGILEELV